MKTVEKFSIREVVTDYLLHLESGRSKGTHRRARWAFQRFLSWCEREGIVHLEDLTRKVLLEFSIYLRQTELAPASQGITLKTVKAWLYWCESEELIERYPLRAHDFPPQPPPRPKPLTVDQVNHLLNLVYGRHWIQKRDYALLMTLLYTGLRRNELLQMKVRCLETGTVAVIQKGNRFHVAHLDHECMAAVRSYLRSFSSAEGVRLDPDDFLWRSFRAGKPLTSAGLSALFQRFSNQSGFRVTPHMLRATSATLRLAAGASTELVKRALGHESDSAIRAYVRLAENDVARLLSETSPLQFLKTRPGGSRR